jgi:hypothetical protein
VTGKVGHYYSADHGSMSAFSVWSTFHHISDFTLQKKSCPPSGAEVRHETGHETSAG